MRSQRGLILQIGKYCPAYPEAVKPGITSFPVLAAFKSDEGSLAYQDWLQTLLDLLMMFRIQRPSGGLVF